MFSNSIIRFSDDPPDHVHKRGEKSHRFLNQGNGGGSILVSRCKSLIGCLDLSGVNYSMTKKSTLDNGTSVKTSNDCPPELRLCATIIYDVKNFMGVICRTQFSYMRVHSLQGWQFRRVTEVRISMSKTNRVFRWVSWQLLRRIWKSLILVLVLAAAN